MITHLKIKPSKCIGMRSLSHNSKYSNCNSSKIDYYHNISWSNNTFKSNWPYRTNISKNSPVISLNICCRSYLYTMREGKAHSRQIWDWMACIICYRLVPADVVSGFFSRWTARGTYVKPRVWRLPKLMDEGESEVLNLETAETRPSMVSFSTSILEASAFLWTACLL